MKRFFFLASVLFITACGGKNANQQKAEALVTDYLKKTVATPTSYQSIGFDTLREEHDQFMTAEPEGRRLNNLSKAFFDSATVYKKKEDAELMKVKPDLKLVKNYMMADGAFGRKSDSVAAILQQKSKGYVGKKITYTINHIYKVNNSLGKLAEHTTTFFINSDLTKVERMQEAK